MCISCLKQRIFQPLQNYSAITTGTSDYITAVGKMIAEYAHLLICIYSRSNHSYSAARSNCYNHCMFTNGTASKVCQCTITSTNDKSSCNNPLQSFICGVITSRQYIFFIDTRYRF